MTESTVLRTILVVSLTATSLRAQPKAQPVKAPVATSIENVELVAAGTDHVRFEVHAKVTAARSVTVTRIRFEEMRLGDIPFYLAPMDRRLQLKSGQAIELPGIGMTVYFRDMDSLSPLMDIIRNGEIRIRGRASAELDLNLIERIGARQWKGRADFPIDDAMPVSLPGGIAGRTAAVFALNAAQTALGMAGSALNGLRASQEKWNGELKTDFSESLLNIESSYKLLTAEGQTIEVSSRALGFRISEDRILVTGEGAEPWKYDGDTTALLQSGKVTLVADSRNLSAWPVGAPADSAGSLANGLLQIERVATPEQPGAALRDTDSNYAIIRISAGESRRKAIPTAQSTSGQSWDRVAVFKLDTNGAAETILGPAHRQDNRLIFDTPVDDEAFGSPVIVPGGVIGIVQDERSGMILPR